MRIQIYLLLVQNIIYNQYKLVNGMAMVGENVKRAKEGDFPSVVSIKLVSRENSEQEKDHGCVGTIIAKNKVLTVAHGIVKIPLNLIEVQVGSNDLRQGIRMAIKRIILYDTWVKEKGMKLEFSENDIAIILLKTDIPSEVVPVSYSFLKSRELFEKSVVTAGWGRTKTGSRSRYLDTVCLKVLRQIDCLQRIDSLAKSNTILDDRYICTCADPYAFLRKGDSGGPLFFNGKLVAINKATTPFPEDNFHPYKVNVHLGIYYYQNFILDIINNY